MDLFDLKTIIIMIIALSIVMPIVWLLIENKDRSDKAKNNYGATLFLKKVKYNPSHRIYLYLSKVPVTSNYIQKISRRYEIISPESPETIERKTMILTCVTFSLCVLNIILTSMLGLSLHNYVLSIYLIFVINNEVINYFVSTEEIKLLDELERFVTNVGDNYFNRYHIDDAILDAIDGQMSEGMKTHAKLLHEIVTSNEIPDDVAGYNQRMHNKYLKMFLSLCINVIEHGDKKMNGQRLLTHNLLSLKKEINLEYLKQKKLRYVFSGSIFVAVVVCIPLTWIQSFGVSVAPDLERIYKSQVGILYIGLIFLASAFMYVIINNAKEIKKPQVKTYTYLKKLETSLIIKAALNNFSNKFYRIMILLQETLKRLGESITPRQLILKSILTSLAAFTACLGLFFYIHENNKQFITEKVMPAEISALAGTAQMSDMIEDIIIDYTHQYQGKEGSVTAEEVLSSIQKNDRIYNTALKEKISVIVAERVSKYRNEYLKWYELLTCIGVAAVAFVVPFSMLFYRRKLLQSSMADEVSQFDAIIYMLMHSDYVTAMDILEQMELFAIVFRPSLRECINEYNSGDIEALQKLKEKETYGPFQRLVDSLIKCDEIAISEAFNKISADRENYYERRKQEDEITIQKRVDNIAPLAWLPGFLVIIYLVLPLLYAGMKELMALKTMIQEMGIV